MEWNLISWAEYLVDAKIDLVSFKEDTLLFDTGVTNTNQEGVKNLATPGMSTLIRSIPRSVLT